jgi:hypothetical protein
LDAERQQDENRENAHASRNAMLRITCIIQRTQMPTCEFGLNERHSPHWHMLTSYIIERLQQHTSSALKFEKHPIEN